MPIERLSLPQGVTVPIEPEIIKPAIARLAAIYIRKFVTLRPGEYDLTPEVWEHNAYTHHLTVHDNDTATYRAMPVDEDAGTWESDAIERGFVPGGRMFKIPQDMPTAVILGPAPDGASLKLFELIQHI